MPILAGDPHLRVKVPNFWHQTSLRLKTMDGVPGWVIEVLHLHHVVIYNFTERVD